MPQISTHLAGSLSEEKLPVGPMVSPRPGPTFEMAVAAPEDGRLQVEAGDAERHGNHGERGDEEEHEARHRGSHRRRDRFAGVVGNIDAVGWSSRPICARASANRTWRRNT